MPFKVDAEMLGEVFSILFPVDSKRAVIVAVRPAV
jgi:hypothetical protein